MYTTFVCCSYTRRSGGVSARYLGIYINVKTQSRRGYTYIYPRRRSSWNNIIFDVVHVTRITCEGGKMYSYYWELSRLTGSIKLSAEMPIHGLGNYPQFCTLPCTNDCSTHRVVRNSNRHSRTSLYLLLFFFFPNIFRLNTNWNYT